MAKLRALAECGDGVYRFLEPLKFALDQSQWAGEKLSNFLKRWDMAGGPLHIDRARSQFVWHFVRQHHRCTAQEHQGLYDQYVCLLRFYKRRCETFHTIDSRARRHIRLASIQRSRRELANGKYWFKSRLEENAVAEALAHVEKRV